jgi:hypothetical protein
MRGVGNVSRSCPVANFVFKIVFWYHTVSFSKTMFFLYHVVCTTVFRAFFFRFLFPKF